MSNKKKSIFEQEISRRNFLKRSLGTAAGVSLLMMPGLRLFAEKGGRKPSGKSVTLEFVVWNYALDTIQDNIKKFEAEHPDISVHLTDYTWPTYHDTLVLRFKGKTKTDVIYNGEDWLPEWAAAGWVKP